MTVVVRALAAACSTALRVFLPCLAGMVAGLLIDTRAVQAEALVALCSGSDALFARWQRDWTWMPATHALMLAAALPAVVLAERKPRVPRLCAHGLCLLAMSAGMAWGGGFGLTFAHALGSAGAGLFAAMAIGMGVGTVLVAPLYGLTGSTPDKAPSDANGRACVCRRPAPEAPHPPALPP